MQNTKEIWGVLCSNEVQKEQGSYVYHCGTEGTTSRPQVGWDSIAPLTRLRRAQAEGQYPVTVVCRFGKIQVMMKAKEKGSV